MAEIDLPEILNIPPKMLPLITDINKYRYFLIEGGRDGGKSQSVARFLCYLSEQSSLRIVCGREIQNTIEESVYTIFSDLIRGYELNFEVLTSKIEHRKTGSNIRFRGFREQGAINIKGLEGVDILWVDESQAITKQTLDVIIPTIRKEKAKIIWTMNRHTENDPVYLFFVNRTDCLHIHIDYLDNPFCSPAMQKEAQECKERSLEDYNHIWLGQPLAKSEDYLFSMDTIKASLDLDMDRAGVQRSLIATDVARFGDCETVFTVLKSHGPIMWEQTHIEAYKHKGLDETLGRCIAMQKEFDAEAVVPDDDGIGGGITDLLLSSAKQFTVIPFNDMKNYTNDKYYDRRTEGYFKLKELLEKKWLKVLNDPVMIEQMLTIKYKYKPNGKIVLITKDEMRKDGLPSPDRADSLMMGVYYCDSLMGPGRNDPLPRYGADEENKTIGVNLPAYGLL